MTATPLLEATATPAAPARRRPAVRRVAAAGLVGLAALALVGPLVLPDPTAQDLARYLEPPSLDEPLGRDDYGRSVLARLAHATRLSLLLAAGCVATALVLGTVTGIASAWFGGWVDGVLRALSETLVAIPGLLVVLLVAALATGGSLWPLYLGLALAQWVEYFRVVRARSGLVLGSPAVEAAGLLRLGAPHVVRRHLWPDLRPLLTTLASLGMVTSVLAMSTLGFVKVGLRPPRAELGLMITESFPFYDVAPWLTLAPIGVLFLLTLCFLGLRSTEGAR
ncbi:ABC transporter permease [Nocardioides coralli]|uniref:ABC transporter permease n=1 Tax=Nocardioides coralli TaxID=2872154 RepID=UPI001CA3C29F|nr:ABC transporter permease [Nocardioides coralli]QZY30119.1 ABC transporter permease [Nocardioides coralli]